MDDSIELIDYIGNNDSVTILGSYNGKKTLITQKFLAKFNVNDVKSLIFKEKDGVKALAISESLNFVFWYSQLEYVDLSGLDTSNVTDMSGMFESCNFLTQVNLKGLNTENVVNMSAMFARCKNLTDLDLSSFNTSNTKYMLSMFEDCDALETLDLSKFNTKNVELMKYMFRGCSNLLSLDLSNFACDNIFDNIYMFSACNSLRKVIVTDATIIEELESNVEILEAI
jgi:surface protein